MSIAAVPAYLGQNFNEASPGMRFGMYLAIWTSREDQERTVNDLAGRGSREAEEIRRIRDELGMDAAITHARERRGLPGLWEKNDAGARRVWEGIVRLTRTDLDAIQGLVTRQARLAAGCSGAASLRLQARATAPFMTGLGNEHPLENGFAFLWPYGIPYLPGSGVKGVLRQAARELAGGAWGETHGWSPEQRYEVRDAKGRAQALSMLDVLFGKETGGGETEHFRGVLAFWDVIPEIKDNRLMVEIMTPHQTDYYRGNEAPHDSGNPNPISFLTVPPGSKFTFHVLCDTVRLRRIAPDLAEGDRWRTLIEAAFEHAFEWLGFGARTAVGYGAMATDTQGGVTDAAPALEAALETWEAARVVYHPGAQELSAVFQGQTALAQGEEAKRLLEGMPKSLVRKLRKGSDLTVRVERMGNRILIRELVIPE